VVRRPKQVESICVRARLETAHLYENDPTLTTLYITAREVAGCFAGGRPFGEIPSGPWVVYERDLNPSFAPLLVESRKVGTEAVVAANAISRQVRNEVISSFRPSRRYTLGTVDFLHTNFALRELVTGIDPADIEQRPELASAIKQVTQGLKTGQSQPLSSKEIEVRQVLLNALGIRASNGSLEAQREQIIGQRPPRSTTQQKRLTKQRRKDSKDER
jgi:hypothetical protein